jgi:hypothetical protein
MVDVDQDQAERPSEGRPAQFRDEALAVGQPGEASVVDLAKSPAFRARETPGDRCQQGQFRLSNASVRSRRRRPGTAAYRAHRRLRPRRFAARPGLPGDLGPEFARHLVADQGAAVGANRSRADVRRFRAGRGRAWTGGRGVRHRRRRVAGVLMGRVDDAEQAAMGRIVARSLRIGINGVPDYSVMATRGIIVRPAAGAGGGRREWPLHAVRLRQETGTENPPRGVEDGKIVPSRGPVRPIWPAPSARIYRTGLTMDKNLPVCMRSPKAGRDQDQVKIEWEQGNAITPKRRSRPGPASFSTRRWSPT